MQNCTVGCYTVTHNPNPEWLEAARGSVEGLFDRYVLVDDGSDVPVPGADFRFVTNVGVAAARNKAISMLDTEWIAMLDDDDMMYADTAMEVRALLPTLGADVVSSPVLFFGESSGMWGTRPDMSNILDCNQIPGSSWFRREVWEALKYNDIEAEDWDFWARAVKKKFRFAHVDKPFYRARVHGGSRSSGLVGEAFLRLREKIYENYKRQL